MRKPSLVLIGFIIAVLPIIVSFLTSFFSEGSMFDESSGGGGYLWFLMATLPIGFLVIITGLIVKVVKRFSSKKPNNNQKT